MLQDEDAFVDPLPEPNRSMVWAAMAERAEHVDAFIAVSHYYAARMREAMSLPEDKVHVVYNGTVTEGCGEPRAAPDPPVIGYLGRLCPSMGFDILVEAFIALKSREPFANVRLRMAGGWMSSDEPFLDAARSRLDEAGVAADAEFLPNPAREEKEEFLHGLSVLSVPARHAEAFGLFVLESLAAGVPVVVPRRGAFPELLDATGGGVLCEPDDAEALTDVLAELLAEPDRARALGEAGRSAVLRDFTVERMASDVLRVYDRVLLNMQE
jgi:glycosyltransferase involved in cell wall biosynthesis